MSSVYVSEPPTSGKVVLETTAGDIEIELWSKETPKACRNFIQLCLEGYYDNTIFHRVSPGWIVQGGDPSGTGNGGESIYGTPFADEFHSRLRFNRRGMLGMANTGSNENGSQFFITLTATPELQKKNTLFGAVVGDSLFNALKLGEGEVDKETERPTHPKRIKQVRVLDNPFTDIVARMTPVSVRSLDAPGKTKKKPKVVKNKRLLSFADDDNDADDIMQSDKNRKAMKSSHDLLMSDPMLSKAAAPVRDIAKHSASKMENGNDTVNVSPPANTLVSAEPAKPDIESQILAAENDIQALNKKKSKRIFDRDAGDTDSGRQTKGRKGALSMLTKSGRTSSAGRSSKLPKKTSESELLARLGQFQDRIRSTKQSANEPASDQKSWLAHTLRFQSQSKSNPDSSAS
ncbi:Peptidyl-prolyl isomerase cwc27 [Coemansia sp. RSA 1822]|nr:Peptidyl-prolyl isomerase cwc27 [Coemansia sp. RSA 638]KAJ2544003.1 Peptidyl-prolyl isomerase cwc27 [Coemansia sp. RSA 1853]KAJ2567986.1 Peptidyl-prolyl isomerase cwc27 [Coemansia sp. RSA 1822]